MPDRFPKSDRRAVLSLTTAVLVIITLLVAGDVFFGNKGEEGEIMNGRERGERYEGRDGRNITLHTFDPNTVDSATLVGFGIKAWKVKNFIHYRDAGKRFSTPESILDTYGWTQEDLTPLLPYISISNEYRQKTKPTKTQNYYHKTTHKPTVTDEKNSHQHNDTIHTRRYVSAKFSTFTKVNPNIADTTLLCSIPGIGTKISQAIIRYRNKLGGFHDVHQIAEISLVSPELLEWFELSSDVQVKKIDINKGSFQILNAHPYISYDQTRDLLQYRRLYGNIKDASALAKTGIFTEQELQRLIPYIDF